MIGERLCDLRKDKGITQETLAQELSLTKFTISSYEKDKSTPNDEIKVAIAKYFDVSLDYLLGLINEPFSYKRESDTIIIPKSLPSSTKVSVAEYIEFLEYKQIKKNKKS